MRLVLTVLLIALLAVSALAGQNPDIRLYLDFDPPNGVHRIDVPEDTVVFIYIVLDCFGLEGGLRAFTLCFERTFGASAHDELSFLGGLFMGDVEDPELGFVAAAGEDCVYPDENGMIVAGYVQYYYTGPPGHVRVVPTNLDPMLTTDCNIALDTYCVAANAGIGADPPPGHPGCYCGVVPVEDASWGTIKALYR